MGSSKKRKEKAKDFAKAKLKLGKGKQKAANATDTSFTSKTIALGQQSIGRENKDAPTTKRNLTLGDLQNHLKHYSASTRKDALLGLRELLTSYPELLVSSISSLVPILARMIGDEEASVRKALLAFLAWYLPSIPLVILQPFHSNFLFFTTSALSHIYPDVRLDAVRTLNLLLDTFPGALALRWTSAGFSAAEDNHGTRILECYLALLHVRSGVASNGLRTDMSNATKALILSSLSKFLHLSFAPEGSSASGRQENQATPSVPTWFLANSFATERAFHSFVQGRQSKDKQRLDHDGRVDDGEGFYMPHTAIYNEADAFSLANMATAANEAYAGVAAAPGDASLPTDAQSLLSTLLPILLSAFLDTAPSAFAPASGIASSSSTSSVEAPLETVLAVTQIVRDLWRSVVLNTSVAETLTRSHLAASFKTSQKLAGHMAAYFPFGADQITQNTADVERLLQTQNVAYCELVSLLVLQENTLASDKERRTAQDTKLAAQSNSIRAYVELLLGTSPATTILPVSTSLTAHVYVQLLPTIWSSLSLQTAGAAQGAERMWRTVLQHYLSLPASSGVRKVAFEAISTMMMAQDSTSYRGGTPLHLLARREPELRATVDRFYLSLPRYLWELGNKDERMSMLVIDWLCNSLAKQLLPKEVGVQLSSYVAPFFSTTHPQRGEIAGPWAKLASRDLQHDSLALAWWLAQQDPSAAEKLITAVGQALSAHSRTDLRSAWENLQLAS